MSTYDYSWITVVIALIIFCVAAVIIMNIVEKKNVLVQEHDFISDYIEKKRKFLLKNKSVIDINVYMMLIVACMLLLGFSGYYLTHNYYIMAGVAVCGFFIPDVIVSVMVASKNAKFEEKLQRTLSNLSSSLRAGLTITQAIEEVCTSNFVDDDMKKYFREMNSKIKMGRSIESVFKDFADITQSQDAYDVYAAISMQVLVGGNEAAVLENITENIASRLSMRKEIKSIFTESNMNILVFDFVPVIMIIIMYFMMPDYVMSIFESTVGLIVSVIMVIIMIIGSIVPRMLVRKSLSNQ